MIASALAAQPNLTFLGAGVTCANNAGASATECTIPGGGGTTGYRNLPVTGVKLNDSAPATLDRSGEMDVLAFDAMTKECVRWPFMLPGEYTGSPVLVVKYAMQSATSGGVSIDVDVWASKTGESITTASFGTVNNCDDTAVPGTAGLPDSISCTLTNNDSMAAGDLITIRLCRAVADSADTATGDMKVFGVSFQYAK